MAILTILPQLLCHCECIWTASITSMHLSRYCAKTVNAWSWTKWMIQALDHSPQVWSTLHVVQAILQILSAGRQHEIQQTNWRMSTHSYKLHVFYLCIFLHIMCQKKQEKYLKNRNIFKKYISKHRLGRGWRTFLRVWARIFYKLQRNSFTCPWEFWREKCLEPSLIIINPSAWSDGHCSS